MSFGSSDATGELPVGSASSKESTAASIRTRGEVTEPKLEPYWFGMESSISDDPPARECST